jgi:SNF2 family DNA or RNA helicase
MPKRGEIMQENDIIKFEAKYAKLNDDEKMFLQMLALLLFPHKQTNIFTPLQKVPFEHRDKKRFKYNEMKKALTSLLSKNLITQSDDGYSLDLKLQAHLIVNHVSSNKAKESMIDAIQEANNPYRYSYYGKSDEDLYREFRNALLLGLKYDKRSMKDGKIETFTMELLFTYFSPSILNMIPQQKRSDILSAVIVKKASSYYNLDSIITYLVAEFEENKNPDALYNILLCHLFLGNVKHIEKILNKNILKGYSEIAIKASIGFMKGDIKSAEKYFEKLKNMDKNHSGRSVFCPQGIFAKYYMLTLMTHGDDASLATVVKTANKASKTFSDDISTHAIKATALFLTGEEDKASDIVYKKLESAYGEALKINHFSIMEILLTFLHSSSHSHHPFLYDLKKDIARLFSNGYENGYFFNCYQALKLISAINERQSNVKLNVSLSKEKQEELLKKYEKRYIDYSKLVIPIPPWKAALNKLTLISSNSPKGADDQSRQSESRLIWKFHYMEFEYSDGFSLEIQPLEQLLSKNGKWTKGRSVALKRIMGMELECMSDLDRQIAKKAITAESYYHRGYPKEEYYLNLDKILPLLTKHPYLFLAESITTPVELIQEYPRIEVTKSKGGFKLSLSPAMNSNTSYILRKETPTRFVFTVFDQKMKQIAKSLNSPALMNIPKEGVTELKQTLESLSRLVTVNSNAKELHGSSTTTKTKTVKTVSKTRVHLLPVADGIRVELFTRPFGNEGPYFKPGAGGTNVMSEIKGVPSQIKRDLKKEKENAKRLLNACPSLANRGEINDIFHFESAFECLELLTELNELLNEIIVEWPEGGKISIANTYGLQEMNFIVSSGTDWFSLDGELKIDDKQVLKIAELIEKSKESRFIELDKGRFIALTESLRRKLNSISIFADKNGDKLDVHPLNTHQIHSILEEAKNFKTDKEWKSTIKRIEKLADFRPKIPSTLDAELRSYQVDGVKWLARLAEWGVGACLADDMGLGKTLQALALVLSRAKQGPSLVVAPSSVCSNWISETEKFAPTLKPILFGEGDRSAILAKPKPFDLIVTSYGLLASEEKAFSKINWSHIILDEAQFIKNHKAKRTKAALNLKGDFKLITTGTPVENHLSELWTLFRFINPGLLGTKNQFDAKFAVPIEKNGDHRQQQSLKKLIQPFMLRRLKSAVLDELPPKTEINMIIETSDEEKAFYESLRRESIRKVEESKKVPGGAAHLQILTELTKLRQASCSPSLISKEVKIKSSKLEAFGNIIEELRENRHKALVFSQFIGHLSILREFCDSQSIEYQYLDGSTPTKERAKRVDAFQNGEGDLFLISLKAGGTGLNLTAADYVIHMDPWWNPAVEDQASDRTHRIGQKRPVTVYRLIAKGTVEEKIIDLHKTKRELADALLDGAEASAKMSLDDLMAVLTDSSAT